MFTVDVKQQYNNIVTRKIYKPIHLLIFTQNQEIQRVTSHRLYICNDCSWPEHITYIKDKAWSRINVIRKLKFQLDRKSLETIYIVFIRPLLEYGGVSWYSMRNNNSKNPD